MISNAMLWMGLLCADPSASRGQEALQNRSFTHAAWKISAYDDAWKQWSPKLDAAPADYPAAVRERYGLHPAPFDNGRYPMGLREGPGVFFGKGLTTDCLLCHGGSIFGKSYVGLGNHTLDIQAFFEELGKASGSNGKLPFTFGQVRGTSEAGAMAVYLHSFREPDLKLRFQQHKFPLHDQMIEDVPAWWLLRKKKTMYATGTSDARSVRSIMQFMLSPLNPAERFTQEEPTFADIQAYLLTIEPPRYPHPFDSPLSLKGEKLFRKHCAQCHGTYGPQGSYPNKIVSLDVVGTDPMRFKGIAADVGAFYNTSWFAKETPPYPVTEPKGYQAPPLDGVWATAPYLHNGSVPTLHDLLDSKSRPTIFTRNYRTDAESFDLKKNGWKVEVLKSVPSDLSPFERRKIYDTRQPGRGNGGHAFGDALSDDERRAVIEYLKTL